MTTTGDGSMSAFVLRSYEEAPALAEFPRPAPEEGTLLDVRAAGLNPFDVVYSAGGHSIGKPPLPSVVGREGVGIGPDGRRHFFRAAIPPYGSLATRTPVSTDALLEVREDISDAIAIGVGVAGITAYVALTEWAEVGPGDVVAILGATGAVGRIAAQVARLLGADRVVAVGRRRTTLDRILELGADAAVEIRDGGDLSAEIEEAAGGQVDVVIDLLWGSPARAALEVAGTRARFVQIGSSAGTEATMPANPWRTRGVSLLGFSLFRAAPQLQREAYAALLDHVAAGRVEVDTEVLPFADLDRAWRRLVIGCDRKLVIEIP